MCNITAATNRVSTPDESLVESSSDCSPALSKLFVGEIVPASVAVLSLMFPVLAPVNKTETYRGDVTMTL